MAWILRDGRTGGQLASGQRAHRRRTWAAANGLLAGYAGLAGATAVAVIVSGTHQPGRALAVLAVAAFGIGTRATLPVALASGGMGWLFYSGFITGRHGDLVWQGTTDVKRIGILLGAAVCGVAVSWLRSLAGTVA
jgi:hypothetical protein